LIEEATAGVRVPPLLGDMLLLYRTGRSHGVIRIIHACASIGITGTKVLEAKDYGEQRLLLVAL
jgi:hypothetical protein